MHVERELRRFRAAFYITPHFANWVRTRAAELGRAGASFQIVMVWGRRRFRIGSVPQGDPYFAIEREDGSIEHSPHVDAVASRWRW
jgi:hypothetical protein